LNDEKEGFWIPQVKKTDFRSAICAATSKLSQFPSKITDHRLFEFSHEKVADQHHQYELMDVGRLLEPPLLHNNSKTCKMRELPLFCQLFFACFTEKGTPSLPNTRPHSISYG
jgi:hypothetical protein